MLETIKISQFFNNIAKQISFDVDIYVKHLIDQPNYFRVNTLKITLKEFQNMSEFEYEKTGYKYGFIYKGKEKIGKTLAYFLGYIQPQSLSSMMPVLAFNKDNIDSKIFLDAAAAPGGKTSQIAAIKNNKHGILALDNRYERISLLVSNLDRLGVLNTAIKKADARKIKEKNFYDCILLDAPCSSLGSSIHAIKNIKEKRVKNMSRIQKAMILSCFDALKPGGELVYSTCTITAKENEEVIDFLINQRENAKLEHFNLPIKYEKGLDNFNCSSYVKRIYPWHVNSEAFFIAKIRKNR
jgi:16S rRNA (cytosine1407-C5)-methyltransferase